MSDNRYRMLCNVVNLPEPKRYDLSAVMGEIERLQQCANALDELPRATPAPREE